MKENKDIIYLPDGKTLLGSKKIHFKSEKTIPDGDIPDACGELSETHERLHTCYMCREKSHVGEIFPDEDDRFICNKCFLKYIKIPKRIRFPKNQTHQYFRSTMKENR